jgi:hypothetical protein
MSIFMFRRRDRSRVNKELDARDYTAQLFMRNRAAALCRDRAEALRESGAPDEVWREVQSLAQDIFMLTPTR